MKNKMIASAIALIGFAASANAQVNVAAADVSATIVAPISIQKNAELNFGDIAVLSGAGIGTVVMNPGSGRSTNSSSITLIPSTNTPTLAKFTVTGANGYSYEIDISPEVTIVNGSNSAESMLVNNFQTSFGEDVITSTFDGTTSSFFVGATLNVKANQLAGVYTAPLGLIVTVNYN